MSPFYDYVPGKIEVTFDHSGPLELKFTSVFCPFRDFIRWLEAVSVGVQECAFTWDAEGPDGRMAWKRIWGEEGWLAIFWPWVYGEEDEKVYKVRLERQDMVKTFYRGFRGFVESSRYNPLQYEELPGDTCNGFSGANLDSLKSEIVEGFLSNS